MVGGGPGAFIGEVHRKAAALDGQVELVAGAFSSFPEKSLRKGEELFLNRDRIYKSYKEMVEKESSMSEEERIDFVTIVTPNNTHFEIAKAFILKGFNVFCEKPMVLTIKEADELFKLVKETGIMFAVAYNYACYPMVKQARELVKKGVLGKIHRVVVEFFSGWLLKLLADNTINKKDIWRLDPKKVGYSSCIADIGSHAENLAHYITGLEIEKLYADINTYIPGSTLEDEGSILVHFKNGARGVINVSQVATGEENNLNIRIYGDKGSLMWYQENPNKLYVRLLNEPEQIYKRGNSYLEPIVKHNTRLPGGCPEAFFEAFGNIYTNFAGAIKAKKGGEKSTEIYKDFPDALDGARGVYFITRAVESGKNKKWADLNFKKY